MSYSRLRSSEIRKNFIVTLYALFAVTSLHAAAPTLDALYPTGARPGEKATIAIVGKSDPWPVSAWCSRPGITITTDKEKKGELIFDIAADAKPGPVLLRLFNAEGASDLHTFIVGSKSVAEISEIEPNSTLTEPKSLDPEGKLPTPLPVVINAKLSESSDVDLFPISLIKGQTLHAAIDAYALISPVDPHLVLYGPAPQREVLVLANDGPNTLDARLDYTATQDGDYLIGVMGFIHPPSSTINFTSNQSAVYRLTLSTGPWMKFADPTVVSASKASTLKLHDSNSDKPIDLTLAPADPKIESDFDAEAPYPVRTVSHPNFANTLAVPASDLPLQSGEKITLPAAFTGTLAKTNETDALKFTAKKGEKIQFKLGAHYLNSDLDPVLIIESHDGKELKRADDTKTSVDAELLWASPADGDYVARIADVIGSGSENHRYLLTAESPAPDFSAIVEASKFELKAGDKAEITVKLTRTNEHKLPLEAKFENLPAGIKVSVADIPAKTGDFKITLNAEATAKSASQAIQIVLTEKAEDGKTRSKPAHFTFVGADWRGPYLIETTRELWLTVLAKPEEKKKEEPKTDDKKK